MRFDPQDHDQDVDGGPSLSPQAMPGEIYPPVSPARRRRLVRYVAATVSVCVVLCVAALVRVGMEHVNAASERDDVALAPVAAATPPGTPEPLPSAGPLSGVGLTPSAKTAAPPKTPAEAKEAAYRSCVKSTKKGSAAQRECRAMVR